MIAPVLAALAGLQAAPPAAPDARTPAAVLDLAAELARIVDLPSREQRAAAADELARRPELSTPREPALGLDALLAACRSFAPRAPADEAIDRPGHHAHEVDLAAHGGSNARTTVFVRLPKDHGRSKRAPLMLSFPPGGSIGRGLAKVWGPVADELGMIVVAPNEAGDAVEYGWTDRERSDALAVLRWARRTFDVDEDRVYVSGVDRGGHLAWDLALRWPDRFAALAPFLGLPGLDPARGESATGARYLENVAHLPIRALQGLKDDEWRLVDLSLAFEKLGARGARDARIVEFPEYGHAFDFEAVDWKAWLGAARRDPAPARVVRAAARLDEARTAWAEIRSFGPGIGDALRPDANPPADAAPEGEAGTNDLAARRRDLASRLDARTARVEVERVAPNRFVAKGRRVGSLRLWLSKDLADLSADVEVSLESELSRDRRAAARVSQRPIEHVGTLLADFAERFDRSYLPVATIEVDVRQHPR